MYFIYSSHLGNKGHAVKTSNIFEQQTLVTNFIPLLCALRQDEICKCHGSTTQWQDTS